MHHPLVPKPEQPTSQPQSQQNPQPNIHLKNTIRRIPHDPIEKNPTLTPYNDTRKEKAHIPNPKPLTLQNGNGHSSPETQNR